MISVWHSHPWAELTAGTKLSFDRCISLSVAGQVQVFILLSPLLAVLATLLRNCHSIVVFVPAQ